MVLREAARVLRVAASVLEDDDEDDDIPFQHLLEPPDELRTPDLSRTKRLDCEQEAQGLDTDRRTEDVRSVGMPVRGSRGRGR